MEIRKEWKDAIYTALQEFEIPEDEWKKFESCLQGIRLKNKDYLERQGEKPEYISIIIEGIFRAFYLTESGDEKTIVFRGPGKLLSTYSSFIDEKSSKFSIQALEDSIVLCISIEDFRKLIDENSFWQKIAGEYYTRLFIEKEKREHSLLSEDARTRYENFLKDYPELINRINHYYIASYLGISNVSLSRIRNS